jgi:hypothetical protein
MRYTIRRTATPPELTAPWNAPVWEHALTLEIMNFHERSTEHHPRTQARVLYDAATLYLHFRVQDHYVRSVVTAYQGSVCGDSCVEFFVKPKADKGYFNFEINAGGTLLLYYIEDPSRGPNGFRKSEPVKPEHGGLVKIHHTLPAVVEPEIQEDLTWRISYAVPFALFAAYAGDLGTVAGQEWRANFYKCADKTSHPHWASWSPVEILNFHQPQHFAPIVFEA